MQKNNPSGTPRLTDAEECTVRCALTYCGRHKLSSLRSMLVMLAEKLNTIIPEIARLKKQHQTDQYHIKLLMEENARLNRENVREGANQ